MKIKTEETFDAAHYIEGDEGKCGNLHGHRWRVVLKVEGPLTEDMLFDFRELDEVIDEYDHGYLNEILSVNPTAENIASCILEQIVQEDSSLDYTVRVYESPKSYAEVSSEIENK